MPHHKRSGNGNRYKTLRRPSANFTAMIAYGAMPRLRIPTCALSPRPAMAHLCVLLRRLGRDNAGNTLMMVALSIFPLLAMIGGGIDIGRTYLVQARLQQSCDAGVLRARKELGAISNFNASTDTSRVVDAGTRMFQINFSSGMYGSVSRAFAVTINADQSITGTAGATVPLAIMQIFGKQAIPLTVHCTAQLNAPNTDVMMALDVTGSMNETNPGDTSPKIAILKTVVKSFFATMESVKQSGSRMRYGFVPYSTNVNVGSLLLDNWVVTSWTYPSRTLVGSGNSSGTYSYYTSSSVVSGTYGTTNSTYAATYNSFSRTWSCSKPSDTLGNSTRLVSTTSTAVTGPPSGTRTVSTYNTTYNGSTYSVSQSGTTCTLTKTTYSNYILTYQYITEPKLGNGGQWNYADVTKDVSAWRTQSNGCVEERGTYVIDDYNNVDLTRAKDLDIDSVPVAGDATTQWRPEYPQLIYERAMLWDNTGSFSTASVKTSAEYIAPNMAGFAACPAASKKLQTWTASSLATYIDSLAAGGSTYHDIGMIWAARLLSPTGLFASENADVSSTRPTSRHLIFLTDGQTSTLDISYGAYGVEPLSKRRWYQGASKTLTETVESRFAFLCDEVKKKNITIWFIAFGTDLNPLMTQCAGEGHYFAASNATDLNAAFEQIARSIGELRLAQ